MLFACGVCGVSMLSASLPPFHDWSYLLVAVFIAYNFIIVREGKGTGRTVIGNLLKALVLYVISVAFLAGLVWPILLLTALGFLLSRLRAPDRVVRNLSLVLLLLFLGTGVWRFHQARAQGRFWQLSRLHAGSPGIFYFSRTAEQGVFTDQELLEGLRGENSDVSRNCGEILLRRVRKIESPEELEALRAAVVAASKGDTTAQLLGTVDDRLAELRPEPEAKGPPAPKTLPSKEESHRKP